MDEPIPSTNEIEIQSLSESMMNMSIDGSIIESGGTSNDKTHYGRTVKIPSYLKDFEMS